MVYLLYNYYKYIYKYIYIYSWWDLETNFCSFFHISLSSISKGVDWNDGDVISRFQCVPQHGCGIPMRIPLRGPTSIMLLWHMERTLNRLDWSRWFLFIPRIPRDFRPVPRARSASFHPSFWTFAMIPKQKGLEKLSHQYDQSRRLMDTLHV